MYDIRQFKPLMYVLVIVGVIGFSLAAQSPAMLLLAGGAVAVNAWLVGTKRFTPMPRLVANAITLIAFLFVAQQVLAVRSTPILVIGQFLVLLQVVKLFEQRGNRDYAQLLVLSLLLMVAASITTSSLVFGILLIAYLFLSLYCCLLFHLKVETDLARAAYALPEDKINPNALRQDQRHLSQSMRRLTGLVSSVSIFTAVVVFLVFPRGTGANLLGSMQIRPAQTLTGFSDQLSFQQIANITQNNEIVAHVKLWKDGELVQGSQTLYLRGVTLDHYEGNSNARWQWTRTPAEEGGYAASVTKYGPNETLETRHEAPPGTPVFRQQITLLPTGTPTIFAMPYPLTITPKRDMRLRYIERDEIIQSGEPLTQKVEYEVTSADASVPQTPREMRFLAYQPAMAYQSNIDPRIREYLSRIDISDLVRQRDSGPSAKQGWAPHPLDEEIAKRIEKHLQTQFSYTLDLTEFGRTHDSDPLVKFLYDFKKGHCEYFAGAMTLLCQSLNMRSRVVVGFKCDEYNTLNGSFTVRQSHAHAWVEVLTPNGWKTFDPTSGRESNSAAAGLFSKVRSFFDFLEFQWGKSVIAYDNENRENLISSVSNQLDKTAVSSQNYYGNMLEWVKNWFGVFASRVVGPIVFLLGCGLVFAIGWFFWERWRLRRRAERIGLDILPTTDQLRLVRQLGFYDDLIRLLERHNMTRPAHLTPKEFAESLTYLPSETYDSVRRLTSIFYKIRFGRMKLTGPQQRRLQTVLGRVATSLGPAPQPPTST